MIGRLRALAGGTGVGWFAGASLFLAAVAVASVGLWTVALLLLAGVTYLMGRWDRRRDRVAAFAELRADNDLLRARNAGLAAALAERREALDYETRRAWRWADDSRLMPDNDGYYSAAVVHDRNTGAATPNRGVPAAQVRAATTNP